MNVRLLWILYGLLLTFSNSTWAQDKKDSVLISEYTPLPTNQNIILYKYYYGSILTLSPDLPLDQKKDWYFVYTQAVHSCEKRFVYPEDFNASVKAARQKFQDECYYETVVQMNNFENNLYFQKRRPEYDIYKNNAPFARILEDTLSCVDCSLYPNRNSDVTTLYSPLLKKKIRVFQMNDIQKDIFSHIFSGTKDNVRIVEASQDVLQQWADRINSAKNRTELKLVMDDFVNHIHFTPIETRRQLIELGKQIDQGENNREILDTTSKKD